MDIKAGPDCYRIMSFEKYIEYKKSFKEFYMP